MKKKKTKEKKNILLWKIHFEQPQHGCFTLTLEYYVINLYANGIAIARELCDQL